MKDTLSAADWMAILDGMVRDVLAAESDLNALDSELGDGDHGMSMAIGFRGVREKLSGRASDTTDIGAILKTAGMAFVSSVGGAAGPLFGTILLRAGMTIGPRQSCGLADLAAALDAAAQAVAKRGECQLGDKTLLDVLQPVAESLKEGHSRGLAILPALQAAQEQAEASLAATRKMVCRRGRSSRFGEKSVGHLDPGAATMALLVKSMTRTVQTRMKN